MNIIMTYGIGVFLGCFFIMTFALSRIPNDVFPEDYEFRLDPFWYIISVLFLGGTVAYFIFPHGTDMVHPAGYMNFVLPIVFAILIYFSYLLDVHWFTNLLLLLAASIITFMQPNDFVLFSEYLTPWQDKFAVVALIFIFAKGLGLLNGLGAIASLQFSAVMGSMILLAYFGAVPQLFGVIAFAYLGTMLAFALFSWPPEKIVISHGAFVSLGFVMACFMHSAATEFAEASVFIAASYIVTEIFISLYNHFIMRDKAPDLTMSTSYYKSSNDRQFETGVVRGVLKILLIDIVLSLMQIAASERFALPFFAIMLNLWFLSILSGDTKPEELFSLSKIGKRTIKGLFSKKSSKK